MRLASNIGWNGFRLILISALLCMFFSSGEVSGQEPPPRPVIINPTAQNLKFGAFTLGSSGGTITIGSDGTRSATGDVIPLGLGFAFSTAKYEIEANEGTLISIMNGSDVTLPGSNSGTMILHIGDADPASPFITILPYPELTILNIGGTLTVGDLTSNPAGSYEGEFEITLVVE